MLLSNVKSLTKEWFSPDYFDFGKIKTFTGEHTHKIAFKKLRELSVLLLSEIELVLCIMW